MAQQGRRKSVFREMDISSEGDSNTSIRRERPQSVRFRSKDEVHFVERYEDECIIDAEAEKEVNDSNFQCAEPNRSPSSNRVQSATYRYGAFLLLLAAIIPLLQNIPIFGHNSFLPLPIQGVNGGVIPDEGRMRREVHLDRRELSPTDVCKRWAQQCK